MTTNHPLELNRAVPSGRIEMFAIRDDDYPGDWFYRLQFYHPDDGPILHYDNAHDDADLGRHHRHICFGEDTEISFHNIVAHVARFLQDMVSIIEEIPDIDTDSDNHD